MPNINLKIYISDSTFDKLDEEDIDIERELTEAAQKRLQELKANA